MLAHYLGSLQEMEVRFLAGRDPDVDYAAIDADHLLERPQI